MKSDETKIYEHDKYKEYTFDPPVKEKDAINPSHYKSKTGLEAIQVIEAFTEGMDGVMAFAAGNAIKYLLRFNNKNGKEDLKKAKWYIDYIIKNC